jgi:hypothetical protein
MSGTAFDIYSGDVIGKNYIVSLILPDAATSIANSIYRSGDINDSYSELRTVSGANITAIGEYVFRDCTSMTAASFPKATAIETAAFQGCDALTAVSFPEAMTVKGSFGYCKSLTSVSLSEATNIGFGTFDGCTALTAVSIPKVTSFVDRVFNGSGTTPLTVTMGAAATTVGAEMFYENYVEVTAAKSVTVRVPNGATGYDIRHGLAECLQFGPQLQHEHPPPTSIW